MIFLQHHNIDKTRWDNAIKNSLNSRIYALSWYLDIVSPGWYALVNDDYSIVCPLPIKKYLGFNIILQPLYTQQLGVFSNQYIDHYIYKQIFEFIYKKYKIGNLNLNSNNVNSKFKCYYPNYLLSLNKTYKELAASFSENHKRNIRKAEKSESIRENIFFNNQIISEYINIHCPELKFKEKDIILKLANTLIYRGLANWQVAIDKNNTILSVILWVKYNNRLIYLFSHSTEKGKMLSSSFFLIDRIIQQTANSNFIIDFEGSKISSIARFFKGFGAAPEFYPSVHWNLLPWPLKLLRI